MKKRKMSLVSLILSLLMFFSSISSISAEYKGLAYDYPIKAGTNEWKRYENRDERLAVLQIPENILLKISTNDLVSLVLDFPYLVDLYSYDKYEDGINYLCEDFNGFNELLNRCDVGVAMLGVYKNMPLINVVSDKSKDYALKSSVLEILLAFPKVQESLSDNEKKL